jgi:hypothetical protein
VRLDSADYLAERHPLRLRARLEVQVVQVLFPSFPSLFKSTLRLPLESALNFIPARFSFKTFSATMRPFISKQFPERKNFSNFKRWNSLSFAKADSALA